MPDPATLRALDAIRAEQRAAVSAINETNDRISALEGPIALILEAATKEPSGDLAEAIQALAASQNRLADRIEAALAELADARAEGGTAEGA